MTEFFLCTHKIRPMNSDDFDVSQDQIIVMLNFAFQRIKLFNAYAMEKMCDAGIPVLDIYQISASYPQGTFDGIHYPHFVFYPAEGALERYFTT